MWKHWPSHNMDIFNNSPRRIHLRADLHARYEILIHQRVEDEAALHRVAGEEEEIAIDQLQRGRLIDNIAYHRIKADLRIGPPRHAPRDMHLVGCQPLP